MRLFLSGESDSGIDEMFHPLIMPLEKRIQAAILDKNDYGNAIEVLGIIPNLINDPVFLAKERKLVKHKDRSTDIRLKINYEKFKNGTNKDRETLLLKNIIQSIRIVGERVKDFDGKRLEADIRKEFDYNEEF